MPRFDGTGPRGGGPMTGAGRGWCNPYSAPYARYGPYNSPYTIPAGPGYAYGFGRPRWGAGRGFWSRGSGWGGGWRHRNWYYATGVPGWARFGYGPAWGAPPAWAYGAYAAEPGREQETEFLRQQAEWLKQQLDAIGQRIEELGKGE